MFFRLVKLIIFVFNCYINLLKKDKSNKKKDKDKDKDNITDINNNVI
jgi:hypothetical protein